MSSESRRQRARPFRVTGGAAAIGSVIAVCALLTGCTSAVTMTERPSAAEPTAPIATAAPTPTPTAASMPRDMQAAALALATIDELADVPQYRRASFGDGWVDVDGNGCSTRQDILQRDLESATIADDGCTVLSGTLAVDPYTGATLEFAHDRIGGDSQAVQIDHIISLSAAHRGGAWAWSDDQRVAFANGPATLLAVDGPTNSAKGDRGPAEWMPEDPGFWCEYAARYTGIAGGYGLAVSSEDKRMLVDVLEACG